MVDSLLLELAPVAVLEFVQSLGLLVVEFRREFRRPEVGPQIPFGQPRHEFTPERVLHELINLLVRDTPGELLVGIVLAVDVALHEVSAAERLSQEKAFCAISA